MAEGIFELDVDSEAEIGQDSSSNRSTDFLDNEDDREERRVRSALSAVRLCDSSEALTPGIASASWTPDSPEYGRPEPVIIGVTGGTASGKTSVCKSINDRLQDKRVALITLDSYYRSLTAEEKELVATGDFNFDHPNAFDWPLVREHIAAIIQRKPIRVPVYDYVNNERFPNKDVLITGADIVFFEGILALWDPVVRLMLSLKIFVECDADIRLARRVVRDMAERGRDLDHILAQYEQTVKPSFERYTLPTKHFADVIIPRGAANTVAIKLLADHFQQKLLTSSSSDHHSLRESRHRVDHSRAEAQILEGQKLTPKE